MIRNAVIHVLSEQPLIADLFERPASGDLGLLCTNLRTMDGKRPMFVNRSDATFFFPYLHVRFVEIPRASLDPGASNEGDLALAPRTDREHALGANGSEAQDEAELEIDEDFLRRIREV